MKVYYRTVYSDSEVYRRTAIEVIFCCEEAKRAYNEYFIRFGTFEGEYDDEYSSIDAVMISQCSVYDIPVYHHMKIQYCPFCGVKIECIEEERYKLKEKKVTITRTEYIEVPMEDKE